ncbi:hypothetical protein [Actinomadura alba]|uniref:hypothetical protein n=1 Tax=Actinomadura alba TaxID=406431 RepID=UPI001C9BC402|nr:hypothetical protein [Actinomadura alba]
MIDSNHLLFGREGTLPAGSTRMIAQTPMFDHCNLTLTDAVPPDLAQQFGDLLLSMSYADPQVRPLFDLEGLTVWRPGRTNGYAPLETAIDEAGFYDAEGVITVAEYKP